MKTTVIFLFSLVLLSACVVKKKSNQSACGEFQAGEFVAYKTIPVQTGQSNFEALLASYEIQYLNRIDPAFRNSARWDRCNESYQEGALVVSRSSHCESVGDSEWTTCAINDTYTFDVSSGRLRALKSEGSSYFSPLITFSYAEDGQLIEYRNDIERYVFSYDAEGELIDLQKFTGGENPALLEAFCFVNE